MKSAVLWDIKPQFVPHKEHITSLLHNPAGQCYVSFKVFPAMTMKSAVLCDTKSQFIPHTKHYFSPTEFSRLKLYKMWGFPGGDYEECRLLGYKNLVRTSKETHYLSATETSWLILCKIWGFPRYWLWRMYSSWVQDSVRTSQETHYLTATETSRLILCKICFHGSDYEECRLLGYYAVRLL
jgi:hypothetical protein